MDTIKKRPTVAGTLYYENYSLWVPQAFMYCHGWKLEKYSSQECVEEKKKSRSISSSRKGVDCFFILVSS
jgi:hypothetical protein